VRTATGLPLELKWPNDVVTSATGGPTPRRKLAGVLAEASTSADGFQHVVLGIGVNLRPASFPPELANRSTSIEGELGRLVDSAAVLSEILAALALELVPLSRGQTSGLLAKWRRLAPSAVGAPIECDAAGRRISGVASGIADDGALLVRIGDRVERVISGEVVWK
jgi:BirA family biotin operon repressor/biotin-[acetyl-CoA-carboxylase] ligase